MWYSIEQIIKPASLPLAFQMASEPCSALLAGGSYLVAEKSTAITQLIDISGLLNRQIEIEGDEIKIGAGVTLQRLINSFGAEDSWHLPEAARASCASRNIRNQRTVGGEIARKRVNSEINVLLTALEAKLSVVGKSVVFKALSRWDGQGIIDQVLIDTSDLTAVSLQRFALLKSAPALVIMAAARRGELVSLAIGGAANQVLSTAIPLADFDDDFIQSYGERLQQEFLTDSSGSPAHKAQVARVGLRRGREEIR